MIQNDGQPQLNEDGSVTTPDPSDTHTVEEPDGMLRNDVLSLYKKWAKQGRTEEQKWAVMNFLTGTGININLIIRERARHAQLALIERLRKHGHGGGNWRRLLDEEARKLEEK